MTFKPTAEDLVQMEGQGISAAQVQAQIDNFKSGFPKSRLAGTLFCGDVNDARDIEGNPKLDEAFELGKKV